MLQPLTVDVFFQVLELLCMWVKGDFNDDRFLFAFGDASLNLTKRYFRTLKMIHQWKTRSKFKLLKDTKCKHTAYKQASRDGFLPILMLEWPCLPAWGGLNAWILSELVRYPGPGRFLGLWRNLYRQAMKARAQAIKSNQNKMVSVMT